MPDCPASREPRADDERARELARLIPLWPSEIADTSREGRTRLIAKLECALKAERRRGRSGHWTYDLARHAALVRIWRRERAALAALSKQASSQKESARTAGAARLSVVGRSNFQPS